MEDHRSYVWRLMRVSVRSRSFGAWAWWTDEAFASAALEVLGPPVVGRRKLASCRGLDTSEVYGFCRLHKAVQLDLDQPVVPIAMVDPFDAEIVEAFAFCYQREIQFRPVLPADIAEALARHAPAGSGHLSASERGTSSTAFATRRAMFR